MQDINSHPAQELAQANHQNIDMCVPHPLAWMNDNADAEFAKDASVMWSLLKTNERAEVIYAATKRCTLEVDVLTAEL